MIEAAMGAATHAVVVDYYPFSICLAIEGALVFGKHLLRDLDALFS